MYQRQVTFEEAVNSALKKNYFNLDGRASRSEYWWWCLFTIIAGAVVGAIGSFVGLTRILGYALSLFLFLPSLGVSVRRLHDIGKSGWWLLLSFIPLIGTVVLVLVFVKNSDMYPNQYGQVPNIV